MKEEWTPGLKGLGIVVLIFALVAVAGLGSYFATVYSQPATTVQQHPATYQLQLLEPMNTGWNATMAQPKFYVVGAHGLESSANITLPVDTLIQVTIVSYDTPTSGSTDAMGVVNGTVGGNVYLINGTTASMSSMPTQWGQNVTSVPGADLAHTFTVQGMFNIPVVGGDTTIAYLYFSKPGTYVWLCQTPCGFGPNMADGAMATSGWMTGQLTVR